jgi:signal transduction histidine kinase
MNLNTRDNVLISEENKAIKLFILLFYFIYIGYDVFYYFVFPKYTNKEVGLPDGGFGFLVYVLLLAILPLAIYYIKKRNPFPIKYIFLLLYILIEFSNYYLIYYGKDIPFRGGHVIELFFILFSPIFVNKKYFWLVLSSMVLKYITYGLLFHSKNIIIATVLILFISIVAYILLTRFYSYVKSLTKAYEDSREIEKLAVIGQMATAIAHEIKNPLSSLKGFTQLQQEVGKGNDLYYGIMLSEIDRINSIVSDLLVLGKPNNTIKSSKSLEDIIHYVIKMLEPHGARLSMNFQVIIDDSPVLICDENQLKQVLINLLKNAMEAMPEGGTVTIQTQEKNGYAVVSVIDEGCGIEQEKLAKLGEPFYTTKQNGTGLGLMVTRKIIEEHSGIFSINSELNKGTAVTISLPLDHN